MKSALILVAGLLVMPICGVAEDEKSVEQILECVSGNVPAPDCIRAVRFTARDRLGAKRVTRVRIRGHRAEDGRRRVLLHFVEPPEMVGASLLLIEGEKENQIYYMSPELQQPKQITGSDRALDLFGTDFSYEDLERLEALNQPGASERLEDGVVGDRLVYAVHTLPADEASSNYGAVVSHFDRETCVPLKVEMFDQSGNLRKLLLMNPEQVRKRAEAWIPHQALMQDVVDFTETQMLVESVELRMPASDEQFSPAGLKASATASQPVPPKAP